jgi:hypothetical protein
VPNNDPHKKGNTHFYIIDFNISLLRGEWFDSSFELFVVQQTKAAFNNVYGDKKKSHAFHRNRSGSFSGCFYYASLAHHLGSSIHSWIDAQSFCFVLSELEHGKGSLPWNKFVFQLPKAMMKDEFSVGIHKIHSVLFGDHPSDRWLQLAKEMCLGNFQLTQEPKFEDLCDAIRNTTSEKVLDVLKNMIDSKFCFPLLDSFLDTEARFVFDCINRVCCQQMSGCFEKHESVWRPLETESHKQKDVLREQDRVINDKTLKVEKSLLSHLNKVCDLQCSSEDLLNPSGRGSFQVDAFQDMNECGWFHDRVSKLQSNSRITTAFAFVDALYPKKSSCRIVGEFAAIPSAQSVQNLEPGQWWKTARYKLIQLDDHIAMTALLSPDRKASSGFWQSPLVAMTKYQFGGVVLLGIPEGVLTKGIDEIFVNHHLQLPHLMLLAARGNFAFECLDKVCGEGEKSFAKDVAAVTQVIVTEMLLSEQTQNRQLQETVQALKEREAQREKDIQALKEREAQREKDIQAQKKEIQAQKKEIQALQDQMKELFKGKASAEEKKHPNGKRSSPQKMPKNGASSSSAAGKRK